MDLEKQMGLSDQNAGNVWLTNVNDIPNLILTVLGKLCNHRYDSGKCEECMDPHKRVMDYRKSKWLDASDPKKDKVVCESKSLTIPGFFTTEYDLRFKQCTENCKSCPHELTCSECKVPGNHHKYYLLITESPNLCVRCLPEEGRFINKDDKCESCPKNCVQCSSKTSCSLCKTDYYILSLAKTGLCEPCPDGYEVKGGRCLKVCPKNQYRSKNNVDCLDCNHEFCAECAAETGECTDCIKGYDFEGEGRQCSINCGKKRYADSKTSCKDCPKLCSECRNLDGRCTLCEKGLDLNGKVECWKKCGAGQFNPDQTICRNCPLRCSECSQIQGVCQKCEEGYSLDGNNKCWKDCENHQFNKNQETCQDCPLYCSSCQRETGLCQKCLRGFELRAAANECWIECGNSPQFAQDQSTCRDCPQYCLECEDITGRCKSCHEGLKLQPDEKDQCASQCTEQEFLNEKIACQKCKPGCLSCEDITSNCLACQEGYVKDDSSKQCSLIRLPLRINKIYYSNLSYELEIYFNQQIVEKDLSKNLKVEIYDHDNPNEAIELEKTKINLDDSKSILQIYLNLDQLKEGFNEKEVRVSERSLGAIKSKRDERVIFKNYPISKKEINYFQTGLTQIGAKVGGGSSVVFNGVSLLMILISIGMAVAMVKLLQLIYLLLFINVELPSNTSNFIFSFRKNLLDYVPPFIRFEAKTGSKSRVLRSLQAASGSLAQQSDKDYQQFCILHAKFKENESSCSVFESLGGFFTQALAFLALKLVICLFIWLIDWNAPKTFEEKKNCPKIKKDKIDEKEKEVDKSGCKVEDKTQNGGNFLKNFLQKVNNFLSLGYFHNLFIAMQLKALLGAMVSIVSMTAKDTRGQSNMILSAGVIFFYVSVLVFVSFLVYYKINRLKYPWKRREDQDYESLINRLGLYKDLKKPEKKDMDTSSTAALLIFKLYDMIVPLVLIGYVEKPLVQLAVLILMTGLVLYSLSKHFPYIKKHQNWLEIMNKGAYLIVLIIFLGIYLGKDKISPKIKFFYIGFSIIVIIILLIFFNLCIIIFVGIKTFREDLSKKAQKGRMAKPQGNAHQVSFGRNKSEGPANQRDKAKNQNRDGGAKKSNTDATPAPNLLDQSIKRNRVRPKSQHFFSNSESINHPKERNIDSERNKKTKRQESSLGSNLQFMYGGQKKRKNRSPKHFLSGFAQQHFKNKKMKGKLTSQPPSPDIISRWQLSKPQNSKEKSEFKKESKNRKERHSDENRSSEQIDDSVDFIINLDSERGSQRFD